ncbi:Kae1-like domain-containing protein [Sedimentibacter sp. MB31-C6]|uniref:Kae1-like domain-containing protein n=1 Tax=Sedimentibacter sp. MB31-C6 TaxID=3109366 RepID=UPI002DDCD8AC|nr:hypothetical protein [Sedimentibacter sp. MB36-C1]WSI04189.1 hypothetical protein U8307_14485 [Sedimentibacter sp. MB36-C1]WSI05640.1 hypothetical protein U8307_14585 [Sedimentibacter sp. MB36-C1]
MSDYIMGIDTSAYTTSIALIDSIKGTIETDMRKILSVSPGQRGLRQQDAVFQHLKNFQELIQKTQHNLQNVKTIAVSSKPRNVEGSYMPVFTVGQNYGKVIAKTLNCNYIEYSHQENHIGASVINHYKNIKNNTLAIHISGGTTEFLSIEKIFKGYSTKIIGGSKDITFGQLIDRIGTYLKFPFPCGKYMENYMKENVDIEKIKLPSISGNTFINLSGMENYYKNLYNLNKYNKETIISSLFEYIATCIIYIIKKIELNYNFDTIIITGGVASNDIIRNTIMKELNRKFGIILPTKIYSSDNAVGIAYLPIIDRWYNETKTN